MLRCEPFFISTLCLIQFVFSDFEMPPPCRVSFHRCVVTNAAAVSSQL